MNQTITSLDQPAGLLRRLAAIVYDTIIVITLLMFGTMILLPFNHNQVITSNNHIYPIYLITIIFTYFAYFWIKAQQTIGMRAWHLTIQTFSGEPITLWHATLRFGFAIPSFLLWGSGLLWMCFDKHRRTWHDIWSQTYIRYLG